MKKGRYKEPYSINCRRAVRKLKALAHRYECSAPDDFWDAEDHELCRCYNGIGSTSIVPTWLPECLYKPLRALAEAGIWLVSHLVPLWQVVALIHDGEGRWRKYGRTDFTFHGFLVWNYRTLYNGFLVAIHAYRVYEPGFWALILMSLVFYVFLTVFGYFAWRE